MTEFGPNLADSRPTLDAAKFWRCRPGLARLWKTSARGGGVQRPEPQRAIHKQCSSFVPPPLHLSNTTRPRWRSPSTTSWWDSANTRFGVRVVGLRRALMLLEQPTSAGPFACAPMLRASRRSGRARPHLQHRLGIPRTRADVASARLKPRLERPSPVESPTARPPRRGERQCPSGGAALRLEVTRNWHKIPTLAECPSVSRSVLVSPLMATSPRDDPDFCRG